MPYLNWKEAKIHQSVEELSLGAVKWSLSLHSGELAILISYLEEVFLRDGGELRVGLANEWALFWKINANGSKLLVARPEEGRWVGTLSLDRQHGEKLILELKNLKPGQETRIADLGTDIHPVSNLECRVSLSLAP